MDRRQRKTRKAIFDACVSLIEEKDFQKITVNEIVERADINRGTFYLHFEDKYEMMKSFENEMIEKIEEVLVNNIPNEEQFNEQFLKSRYYTLVQLLNCYVENNDLLQLLLKSGHNASFQAKLREKLHHVFTTKVFPNLKLDYEVPSDLFVILFTSLSLSLAEYANQSNKPIDIEQLAKMFFNILIHGPAKTLGLLQVDDVENKNNYF